MGLNWHINTNFHAPRSFLDHLTPLQTRSPHPLRQVQSPLGPLTLGSTLRSAKNVPRPKSYQYKPMAIVISRTFNFKDTIQGLQAVQNWGNDILVRFCLKILCCNNFASTKNFKEVLEKKNHVYRNLKPLNLYFEIKMKCGMGNLTSSSMMTTLPNNG